MYTENMIGETGRLPTYQRAQDPPGWRFTTRDKYILEAIHAFDGMLGDYQIKRMFFTGLRKTQGRLSLLFHHGYVARPDRRRRASLPCMVYWLDKRGAGYVAGLSGQRIPGFRYRKTPYWLRIEHDMRVNDFRLDVIRACMFSPTLGLEQWIGQEEFWAYPDTVEYRQSNGTYAKRRIRPDGFFSIYTNGQRHRLLVEIDMATEDNPRFAREKVTPGIAYLRSKVYRQRFGGSGSGRCLVVTTGRRRMLNMKRQAETTAGHDAQVFCFTTFDQVTPDTVLTAPIWYRGGDSHPSSLFQL